MIRVRSALSVWRLSLAFWAMGQGLAFACQPPAFVPPGTQVLVVPSSQNGIVTAQDGAIAASEPPPEDEVDGGERPPAAGPPAGVDSPPDAPTSPKDDGPVKRGSPPQAPDPIELEVGLDETGLVSFQFHNQPWPDLLRWLADISELSLDWQELPGDYLNLATPRPYSVVEARDVFNRHLLARGFTLLEFPESLTVVKTEGLNVALVPRVEPEELESLAPHRFVRTSFALQNLIAAQVVEELKGLISSNGALAAMSATNRLEAMDAAINLKELKRILDAAQSLEAMQRLAREFPLEHLRAVDVKKELESFLGLNNRASRGGGGGGQQQQLEMMMEQMQQQMQQQLQQMQGPSGGSRSKRGEEVLISVSSRSNSLIVHAPPDRLALIESFIRRIDVPNRSAENLAGLSARMKVFRLTSLDPTKLVASLKELDVLEPTTRLEIDTDNSAIIAYGSLIDQYAIQQVIDRLDGSARSFEVIQLRRLRADQVAGTIRSLMNLDDDDKSSDSRRRSYYYNPWGYGETSKTASKDKFTIAANVADNQLLIKANPIEREEIRKLLAALGEIPADGDSAGRVRVIDASRTPETYQYLRQLQRQWEALEPGRPLILPEPDRFEPRPPATPPGPPAAVPSPSKAVTSRPVERSRPQDVDPPVTIPVRTVAAYDDDRFPTSGDAEPLTAEIDRERSTPPHDSDSPVHVEIDERGNLLLFSEDLQALGRLEAMMLANRPPQRPYEVFHVRHARASWIALSLQDYFKDREAKDPSQSDRFFSYLFDLPDPAQQQGKGDPQLGARPKLRFVWDNDTNTIVVTGADEADRKTIGELIELWDVPEKPNTKKSKFTKLITLRYTRAENVAETLKEAFRDYLSRTDKTFQQGPGDNDRQQTGAGQKRDGGGFQGGFGLSLTGQLSLGVDRISNRLIVFCEGEELFTLICDLIDELDQAAKPAGTTQIYSVGGNVNPAAIEAALRSMLGPASGGDRGQAGQEEVVEGEVVTGQQPTRSGVNRPGGRAAPARGR